MRICICGGGSLGHVIAGKIADKGEQVSILTRQPDKWNKELQVDDCAGNLFRGKLACVTHKAELVIPDADIILLCLPGFALQSVLELIAPYLSERTYVGSSYVVPDSFLWHITFWENKFHYLAFNGLLI